jgi:hypothetical protein
MNHRYVVALCVVVALAIAVATSVMRDSQAQSTSQSGLEQLIPVSKRKFAPDFALTDAQGQLEIPWYVGFYRQYQGRGLAAIGASMDEDGWKSVRPFLARKEDPETGGVIDMPYPVVIAPPAMAKKYEVTSMPVTVLIDRQGRIALSHTGVVDRRSFERNIQDLLKEPVDASGHL